MARYYSPKEVAKETGFSEGFVRSACKRDRQYHPLPHVKVGDKRPRCLITIANFEAWLEEEKTYQLEG